MVTTDPGFPTECQLLSVERKPIIWQDLFQKLHESERKWTDSAHPLGSANALGKTETRIEKQMDCVVLY